MSSLRDFWSELQMDTFARINTRHYTKVSITPNLSEVKNDLATDATEPPVNLTRGLRTAGGADLTAAVLVLLASPPLVRAGVVGSEAERAEVPSRALLAASSFCRTFQ